MRAIVLAAVLGAVVVSSVWADERPEALAQEEPWTALPDELALILEQKARVYRERALGFTCRERRRLAEYNGREASSERIREYDYILVADAERPEGLAAVRTKPGRPEDSGENVDMDIPEPYFWTQIFQPSIRSTLRFRVGEWHTTPWKLAIPVSWISSSPVFEGERITEWTGTMEIEYRTGNPLKVVARPSFQDERMRLQLERYLTAWRFIGWSAAPPPDGVEVTIHFDHEHDRFTYPSRVEIHRFRQVHRDTRVTISRELLEYGDYRFFGTATQEEIPPLVYQPPES